MAYGVIQALNRPYFTTAGGVQYCLGGSSHTRRGDTTPNFKAVAKRLLPINRYQDSELVQSFPLMSYFVVNSITGAISGTSFAGITSQSQGWNQFYADSGPAVAKLPSEAALRNEALVAALGKLADAKLNLPVAIAESRKTVTLILGTANRVFRAYRAVKRGRFREAERVLGIGSSRGLASNWLEYKYGWMPLLMDVKGAAEHLARRHTSQPVFVSASHTARARESFQSVTKNAMGWFGSGKCTYVRTYTAERECKVKIQARVNSPAALEASQLGLTNPLLVAWELVPFSFVFDWFLQVGNYLQACTALHGLSVDRAMVSTMTDVSGTTTWAEESWKPSSHLTAIPTSGTMTTKDRNYFRDPLTISLSDLSPVRNRDPFKVSRLVTALALLRTRA